MWYMKEMKKIVNLLSTTTQRRGSIGPVLFSLLRLKMVEKNIHVSVVNMNTLECSAVMLLRYPAKSRLVSKIRDLLPVIRFNFNINT